MDKFNDFAVRMIILLSFMTAKAWKQQKWLPPLEYYAGMKKDGASVISIIKNYLNLSKTI